MNRHEQGCLQVGEAGRRTPAAPSLLLKWQQRILRWVPVRTPRVRQLRLIETLNVGQRGSVVLVEWQGVPMLVGTGRDGVTAMASLPGTGGNGGGR